MTGTPHAHLFRIADFNVRLVFKDGGCNGMHLLPSFEPFRTERFDSTDLLFQLTIADTLRPRPKREREHIRVFDTGNGNTVVDRLSNGGYQYIIRDISGTDCALLITNKDFSDCQCALNGSYNMRCFGLNNALMLVFAFAASRMNDDNPIIRIIDGTPYIYGGPWSGKTPCYRNVKARLGAITRIDRAPANSIDKLSPVDAFASVLPACSSMKWDPDIYNRICDTLTRLVETTGIYTLHCLPNQEAAILCNQAIRRT